MIYCNMKKIYVILVYIKIKYMSLIAPSIGIVEAQVAIAVLTKGILSMDTIL